MARIYGAALPCLLIVVLVSCGSEGSAKCAAGEKGIACGKGLNPLAARKDAATAFLREQEDKHKAAETSLEQSEAKLVALQNEIPDKKQEVVELASSVENAKASLAAISAEGSIRMLDRSQPVSLADIDTDAEGNPGAGKLQKQPVKRAGKAVKKTAKQIAGKADVVAERESLQEAQAGLYDIMPFLKGDRFSDDAGAYLLQAENQEGRQQFGARLLLVFWYLHRNQLAEAKTRLDWILENRKSPSKIAQQTVSLWRSMIDHMQNQQKYAMGKERLFEEREAFADLRRSLGLCGVYFNNLYIDKSSMAKIRQQGTEWLWEDLFQEEGMKMIDKLPDHNSKKNSQCYYVPGLLAKEYHSASSFTEAQMLEANHDDIMKELKPFLERANFQRVGGHTTSIDTTLVAQGSWTDVSLFRTGVKDQEVCRELPKLCSLLEREAPEVTKNLQGNTLLSRMDPGTIIKSHRGRSNTQLTMHFALVVPPGAGIKVNKRKGKWEQGKVLVFDDTFPHSVWHKGTDADGPRLVLIMRGYHPEWTLEERIALIMNPKVDHLTMEERLAEVEHLNTPAARERWEARKRLFQNGPSST